MFESSCASLHWFPGPSHHNSALGSPPFQAQDTIKYCLSLVTLVKHSGSEGGISGVKKKRGEMCKFSVQLVMRDLMFLFWFSQVCMLHSAGCRRAGWEPTHVNKLLLRFSFSDGSIMTLVVRRGCCPVSTCFCPACVGSPVQLRDGEGNPPSQEQRSLRAVWLSADSTEHTGEPSGGSAGPINVCYQ